MPDREYNIGDEDVCGGCKKRQWMAVGWVCQPYEFPGKTFGHRFGECALNPKTHISKNVRVREGQQKTKRIVG